MILRLTANPPGEWVTKAVCAHVDPELWFPEKGGDPEPARRICQGCPVRVDCLEHALASEQSSPTGMYGIWGGLTAHERMALLGKRPTKQCDSCDATVVGGTQRCRACHDATRAKKAECVGCGKTVREDMPCPHCTLARATRRAS